MCLIIDANLKGEFLINPSELNEDMKAVYDWLEKQNGKFYLGGKLKTEFYKSISTDKRKKLDDYRASGKLRIVANKKIDEELRKINTQDLKSNDAHIIALAKSAKVTLLVSKDVKLHADFKNLIKHGKVYQYAKQKDDLLKRDTCP